MIPSQTLLTLKIITPEGIIFEKDNLNSINVLLSDHSPIGIRPGHAPLIAETKQGFLRYRDEDLEDKLELYSGVLEIRNNQVTILTAGKVDKTIVQNEDSPISKFDRLMQTLIDQAYPEDDTINE